MGFKCTRGKLYSSFKAVKTALTELMSTRSNFHLKVVCVPGKEHPRVDTISRLHQPGHLR